MKLKGSVTVTVEVDGAEIEEEGPQSSPPYDSGEKEPPALEPLTPQEKNITDIKAASAALMDKKPGLYGEPARSSLAGAMSEEEARAFLTNGGGRSSGR
jgi:hypothetical protein